MEWLLAHADDTSLDEPFTEEEALQMKSNLEAPIEAAKKPLTEEEKAEKLAKLEELRNGYGYLNILCIFCCMYSLRNNFCTPPLTITISNDIQGVPKRRKQSKHPLHHKKMQFSGNSEVHSDQNLGTFDYLYQCSKIFLFKSHLNTLLFQ